MHYKHALSENLIKPAMFLTTPTSHVYNLTLYYIHFEINGVSCNLIGPQDCDFSTNRTPSLAVRFVLKSHLLLTNHIRVLTSANQTYLIVGFKQPINFKKNVKWQTSKNKKFTCHE
jgi:hypothetical protein